MKNIKENIWFIALLFLLLTSLSFGQPSSHPVSIHATVEKKLAESFSRKGRLYVFFSLDSVREPRTQTWPSPNRKTYIFAKNLTDFDPKKPMKLNDVSGWIGTPKWKLTDVPDGVYYVQLLWD